MGCSINAVLQKHINNKWETIDTDVLQFCSSVAREFNSFTQDFRTNQFPSDFQVLKDLSGCITHNGFYMGEHSFGWFTLEQLCLAENEEYPKYGIEVTDTGVRVDIDYKLNEALDEIRTIQKAYRSMYYELDKYRLVIGYDS